MAAVCFCYKEFTMDTIVSYFQTLGLDFYQLLTTAGVLLVGSLLFGAFGRFVFGKKSCGNWKKGFAK